MEFSCQVCQNRLSIPAERLPEAKTVNVICPRCKNKISIDTRKKEKEYLDVMDHGLESSDFKEDSFQEPIQKEKQSSSSGKTGLHSSEDDLKRSLICDDHTSKGTGIAVIMEDMGYIVTIGKNPEDVLRNLRFSNYDVIILNDQFGGGRPSENPVLKELQIMPIAMRRNIFLALIGTEYTTFDNMMAFSKSANVVISENDLPHFKSIVRRSTSDNEDFYSTFLNEKIHVKI